MPGNALPSEIVKEILVAAGVGVFGAGAGVGDWKIVISRVPDKPNRVIALVDTGGLAPEPGLDINYPSVQIIVRGDPDGYVGGHKKARDIRDVLLGRPSQVVLGDIVASITMPHDIIPLGYDENDRPEFSSNYQLIVHQGDLSNSHRMNTQTGL